MEKLILFSIFFNLISGLLFYKSQRKSDVIYIAWFIPLIIAAAQAGYQMYNSSKQKKAAKAAEGYIPPALKQAEGEALANKSSQLYPGQDIDQQNLRQGTADSFSNASKATNSAGQLLNIASRLSGNQQRGYQDISRQGLASRKNANDQYRALLMDKANAQGDSKRYAEGLRGAAMQNQYNAINSLASGVAATNWGGSSPNYASNPWRLNPQYFSDINGGSNGGNSYLGGMVS